MMKVTVLLFTASLVGQVLADNNTSNANTTAINTSTGNSTLANSSNGTWDQGCNHSQKHCLGDTFSSNGSWNGSIGSCVGLNDSCPCDPVYQESCKDEWGYQWCQTKAWGSCPLNCPAQKHCGRETFSSNGSLNGSVELCVGLNDSCPCDPVYQESCKDEWGYQFCQTNAWGSCPVNCKALNKSWCYSYDYDSNGHSTSFNESCASTAAECKCGNGSLPTACQDDYGGFSCLPKAMGACPIVVTCNHDTENECWGNTYHKNGSVKDYGKKCVPKSQNCSVCDATHEVSCKAPWSGTNDTYCEAKSWGCPLDCGKQPNCWVYEYLTNGSFKFNEWGHPKQTEVCGVNNSCACDATHEHVCDGWCQPKMFGACPVNCEKNGSISCYKDAYDSDGAWANAGAYCHNDTTGTYMCPTLCGANAKMCTYGNWTYCTWTGDTCPVECDKRTQIQCWNNTKDENGHINGSTEFCYAKANENTTCPCASFQKKCKDPTWGDFCIASSDSCPVICDFDTQDHCWIVDYLANGTEDWTSGKESCAAKGACTCGANADKCTYKEPTDSQTYSWCQAKVDPYTGQAMSCPVQCQADEYTCWQQDFNISGYPTTHKETCKKKGEKCPCGKNTTSCREDPSWLKECAGMKGMHCSDTFCIESMDFWTGKKNHCPVVCKEEETRCWIPSFDKKGEFTSAKEECSATKECDCSKGANAKKCRYDEHYTDCIPKDDYCPITCSGSTPVSCPPVDNYDSAGVWLSWSNPKKGEECKAKFSDCACGLGTKHCKDESGESFCELAGNACPVFCKPDQDLCVTDNYVNGSLASFSEKCFMKGEKCPCGKGTVECNVDGHVECVEAGQASATCPCKSSENVCYVQDFSVDGTPAKEVRAQCVKKGVDCPCGKNSKPCGDTGECVATGGKSLASCPNPCTPSSEEAGNETCIKIDLKANGEPTGSPRVSCVKKGDCKPGHGQKVCSTGAWIAQSYACKNIYGVAKIDARRLSVVKIEAGLRQTATLKFTLTNLKAGATSTTIASAKVKVDSILQLMKNHKSTFTMQIAGTEAAMTYAVTNLGATIVTPKQVADKLKTFLNTKEPQIMDALKSLGTVKLGKSGCCQLSTTSKTVKDDSKVVQPSDGGNTKNETKNETTTKNETKSDGDNTGGGNAGPGDRKNASGNGTTNITRANTDAASSAMPCGLSLPQLAAYLLMSGVLAGGFP